jgi:predicted RNA-binding protein YlxR (DUF448 family)
MVVRAPISAMVAREDTPLRRCLASGESLPKERLVRFVLGPDGALVPDVAGTLPGRGLWVTAARDALDRAITARAFARAARQAVVVPDDLTDAVERLLARRCAEYVGLARRAGLAVAGYVAVERWLKAGRDGILLAARDGGEGGRARLASWKLPVIAALDAAELGAAFARESVAHAAVEAGALADAIRREAARLDGFRIMTDGEQTAAGGAR